MGTREDDVGFRRGEVGDLDGRILVVVLVNFFQNAVDESFGFFFVFIKILLLLLRLLSLR